MGWCKGKKEEPTCARASQDCCDIAFLTGSPLATSARQQQASERAMRVGCTYWVVMDHHAVQQSGQGVETTYIQTWEGDKNAAHSEPATLLLGCERVEMKREKSLGPSVQNKAAEPQESESDWLGIGYWKKCRPTSRPQHTGGITLQFQDCSYPSS